jgi:hypothetical protein
MTDEQIALAKRAVACKGWRWMMGMLRGDGFRCTWVDEDERELAAPTWCANGIEWKNRRTGSKDLPDLTDPATLGCLLALVRAAMSADTLYTRPTKTGWTVMLGSGKGKGKVSDGATEAESLIAALEAAP